ncbi:MAG: hypothetical protein J6M95_02115 [Bacilli bacterium]|nr:hypothetical protein [Bacilli bacterium]
MEISRNQQHFIIMTVIYNELTDFTFGEGNISRDASEMIASLCECDISEVDPYIVNTVMVSLKNYSEIRNAYLPYLKNWKWERLPLLTQAILLMSYAHYNYIEKVDRKVIINVAVELAKKYIDDKQSKFINAILDSGVLA